MTTGRINQVSNFQNSPGHSHESVLIFQQRIARKKDAFRVRKNAEFYIRHTDAVFPTNHLLLLTSNKAVIADKTDNESLQFNNNSHNDALTRIHQTYEYNFSLSRDSIMESLQECSRRFNDCEALARIQKRKTQ